MSTRTIASDLEYLRLYLGEEKLTLLGHSNGGAIVLAYAEDFPGHVLAVNGLGQVQARTLVVNRRSDGICSEAAARKIAEGLGDKAELVLVEEAGHLP
ncbi:hypothetical protein CBS147333_9725 [Penicillium roqueforti]|nr:hypothetical protein CBS147354_9783 [Penicillium roqueforti]KAI3095792.1 hypothetical protein CBS147333_9725 [Penicillium roqueforti]KAI3261269.1 hypothetical protein CBS147308_9882 [Penicillium roqueforti]KAI3278657.1 hypothetical protein DTO003C3_9885 [Penicillium roqueforti]